MMRHVEIRARANDRWKRFHEDRCLTLEQKPLVEPGDNIFTMGSCFAREIRAALQRRGHRVGPDYASVVLDPAVTVADELPDRPHLDYFNTFTIRQEFEKILGRWRQSPDDHWIVRRNLFGQSHNYQDPYKRLTFGKTPEHLAETVSRLDACIAEAARSSAVFLFTFGMTEVFRIKANGRIASQKPAYFGGGGERETELFESGFAENFANLEAIHAMILELNPSARIVITVSPVPLGRTFTKRDIAVANIEGKSILRAVSGEFVRKYPDVTYFPAYEMVTLLGEMAFMPGDLRHVNPSVVDHVTASFAHAHVRNAPVLEAERAYSGCGEHLDKPVGT
jgi:hypothetical protein